MTTTTASSTATATATTPIAAIFKAILAGLVRADAAYRQRARLSRLTDAQLADMGMTRADADRAFLQRGRVGRRPELAARRGAR